MHVSNLAIHPIKSTQAQSVGHALVEPRGLADDRRWLVIDSENVGLTGRTHPGLLSISAQVSDSAMRLSAPGMHTLDVEAPRAQGDGLQVSIWRDSVNACLVSKRADRWLSQFLDDDLRLVYMPNDSERQVDPTRAERGDIVSFADAFPLLLIGEASLEDLNARLSEPVSMHRFRPNLTVAGSSAYAEDDWKRLRIGALEFDVADVCDRCIMTTIEPGSGATSTTREPLKTLASYRLIADKGILFGVNLIPRSRGVLSRGAEIEVLE